MLANSPGFAVIAVFTLALGIGANTAIFSVLNSVLLRSLPVAHPEQLAVLTDPDFHGGNFGSQTGERSALAYSEFEYLRDHHDVLGDIFAADSQLPDFEVTMGDSFNGAGANNETARVKLVSGNHFATLGVQPVAGRTFDSEVDRVRGGSPVAVVSYAFWKQRFGLSPDVLGRSVKIHKTSFQIVGVTPPGFFGETVGETPDIWVPMMMQDAIYPGRDYLSASPLGVLNQHMWLQVMGRLKPGGCFGTKLYGHCGSESRHNEAPCVLSRGNAGVSGSLNLVPHRGAPCVAPYSRHMPNSEVRIPIVSGFPLNSLTRSWGFLDPLARSRFAPADSQGLLQQLLQEFLFRWRHHLGELLWPFRHQLLQLGDPPQRFCRGVFANLVYQLECYFQIRHRAIAGQRFFEISCSHMTVRRTTKIAHTLQTNCLQL